jgi:hypothetical protein
MATSQCLNSNSTGNVYTKACNGGSNQNWKFQNKAIINCQTNYCLDSNRQTANSGLVYTMGCNGGNYQNWGFSLKKL